MFRLRPLLLSHSRPLAVGTSLETIVSSRSTVGKVAAPQLRWSLCSVVVSSRPAADATGINAKSPPAMAVLHTMAEDNANYLFKGPSKTIVHSCVCLGLLEFRL